MYKKTSRFTFAFILVVSLFLFVNTVFASGTIILKNRQATSITLSISSGLPVKYPVSFVVQGVLGNDPEYFSSQLITTSENGSGEASFTGLKEDLNYHGYVWYASEGVGVNVATIDFVSVDMIAKITSFSPTSGKVGDVITIIGSNFNGVSGVLFNTTNAVTITNTANQITVKVPTSATSGKITVKTTNGDAISSNNFTVTTTTNPSTCSNGATDYPTCTPPAGGIKEDITKTGETGFSGLVPKCNTGDVITIPAVTEIRKVDGKDVTVVISPARYEYKNPCDFNSLMGGINEFINFVLIILATPLFALILIYVGWLYLSAGGSSENVTKAKKILKNALIGYIIALAAWLIVKTILTALGFTGPMFLG